MQKINCNWILTDIIFYPRETYLSDNLKLLNKSTVILIWKSLK